jgi:hypothetical protein
MHSSHRRTYLLSLIPLWSTWVQF